VSIHSNLSRAIANFIRPKYSGQFANAPPLCPFGDPNLICGSASVVEPALRRRRVPTHLQRRTGDHPAPSMAHDRSGSLLRLRRQGRPHLWSQKRGSRRGVPGLYFVSPAAASPLMAAALSRASREPYLLVLRSRLPSAGRVSSAGLARVSFGDRIVEQHPAALARSGASR
jgi:hypothetical protein